MERKIRMSRFDIGFLLLFGVALGGISMRYSQIYKETLPKQGEAVCRDVEAILGDINKKINTYGTASIQRSMLYEYANGVNIKLIIQK